MSKLSHEYIKGKAKQPDIPTYITHTHTAGFYSENCQGCIYEDKHGTDLYPPPSLYSSDLEGVGNE